MVEIDDLKNELAWKEAELYVLRRKIRAYRLHHFNVRTDYTYSYSDMTIYILGQTIQLTRSQNYIFNILSDFKLHNRSDFYKYAEHTNDIDYQRLSVQIAKLRQRIRPYFDIVSKSYFGYRLVSINYKINQMKGE